MSLPQEVKRLFISEAGGRLGTPAFLAAAGDPIGGAWVNMFTIAGGYVMLTSLVGIRTGVQNAGAGTMQVQHSVAGVMSAVSGAIAGHAVGVLYTITGTPGDALQIGLAGLIPGGLLGSLAGLATNGVVLPAGIVQWTTTSAGPVGTSACRWIAHYIPLDRDAVLV